MAVLVAVVSQFLVGYNTAVMNAPAAVVFPGHSTTVWSIAVSAFAIGGPFGAMVGGLLANKRGRRFVCLFVLRSFTASLTRSLSLTAHRLPVLHCSL